MLSSTGGRVVTNQHQRGVRVERVDPRQSRPGESIVIPEHPSQIRVVDVDLDDLRARYLRGALDSVKPGSALDADDLAFLAEETRWPETRLQEEIDATRR